MGGKHFQMNNGFVAEAKRDVRRLIRQGYTPDVPLLDWGCGAGRLAIGALETWPDFANYDGIDVQRNLVEWARRNVARPGVTFTWVDASNARYNPNGGKGCVIPGETAHYGAVYAYSVLSHMVSADVQGYLLEIRRLLKSNGFALVTAFVEEDVVAEAENPEGYGPLQWQGPLHCVRYDRRYFTSMVHNADLKITDLSYATETDGQTAVILRRSESCDALVDEFPLGNVSDRAAIDQMKVARDASLNAESFPLRALPSQREPPADS